jgi:Fe-S cluster biogenesis protein NfuA
MADHNHQIAGDQERMEALIENISAYIEQYHGGWVKMISFDGKTLKVKLGGACDGCPLTETTLQGWVAGTVRQFFPDVETIEAG